MKNTKQHLLKSFERIRKNRQESTSIKNKHKMLIEDHEQYGGSMIVK